MLRWHYENRFAAAIEQNARVGGYTSNTVPWELLRASGYFPVLLSPRCGATPIADKYMEDVFSPRMRRVLNAVLAAEWPRLKLIVIPRTSEQEHKLFLYLREIARQEPDRKLPSVLLYNLLHARSEEAYQYGLERTRELLPAEPDRVYQAIVEGNAARQALRALLSLRRDRLPGTEALALIGAFYFMDRAEYASLARDAAKEIATRPPVSGPRLLVKGSPLYHPCLHRALESHGAVVVAEDDWWGSRAAGQDIAEDGDPMQAIFEKYYFDAPSPRVFPRAASDDWFLHTATEADAVVFYLPWEDDVLGWDYPRQRHALDRHGIPHMLIRADASAGDLSPEWHERVEDFVTRLKH